MDSIRNAPFGTAALALASLLLTLASCAAPAAAPADEVRTWGTMREALRNGQSERRVVPVQVARPHSIGVGALEGLAGEVTILDGRVLLARGIGHDPWVSQEAGPDDGATLLVLADVAEWEPHQLPACADLAALEAELRARIVATDRDPKQPTPVRIRGRAAYADLHVIAGNCPVANPDGAPAWRFRSEAVEVELVGIHAEDAAGRLTHHTGTTHLHAVIGELSGHLDALALEAGAVLLLPVR